MALSGFEIILYSSLLALFITVAVSAYFRYKLPPKADQIFVSNRNSFLETIFGQLELYDGMYFDHILKRFTDEFGELKRERKEILEKSFKFVEESEIDKQETIDFVQSMKDNETFRILKEDLESSFKRMQDIYQNYRVDRVLYERYFHHDFIRNIDLYYWGTNYYVEWLFKGVTVSSSIDNRKNRAEKIIDYLKKDGSINKKPEKIKNFIDKWQTELKRGY